MTLEQIVHATLVGLKRQPPRSVLGICFHLDFQMRRTGYEGNHDRLLNAAFQAWPKFSGQKSWPVPCPNGGAPEVAYSSAGKHVMWNAQEPYGALRLELLDFLIEHFGKMANA